MDEELVEPIAWGVVSGARRVAVGEGAAAGTSSPRLGGGVAVGSSGMPRRARYGEGASGAGAAGEPPCGSMTTVGSSAWRPLGSSAWSALGSSAWSAPGSSAGSAPGSSRRSDPLSSSTPGRLPLAGSSGKRSELLISSTGGMFLLGGRGGSGVLDGARRGMGVTRRPRPAGPAVGRLEARAAARGGWLAGLGGGLELVGRRARPTSVFGDFSPGPFARSPLWSFSWVTVQAP